MQLLLLQACELCQTHVDDGLGLNLVEVEANHQVLSGLLGRLAGLDDVHDLVNIVRSDN